MEIISERPEDDFWEQRFSLLYLPPVGDVFTICREDCFAYTQVCVTNEGGIYKCMRLEGMPLRLVSRKTISAGDYAEVVEFFNSFPVEQGFVFPSTEVITEVGYAVLRRINNQESRIVLGCLAISEEREFVELGLKVDAFLNRNLTVFSRVLNLIRQRIRG